MPVAQDSLLSDCQKQLKLLEADLKAQAAALPDVDASLRAEYEAARAAGRVGDAFEIWRGEQVTQGAVHWVLGCVFVRFLEDNALIDPLLAGAGDRGRLAEGAEQAFYAQHPTLHERDWLLHAFRQVAALPGGAALFDEAHNPVFRWPLSPDAAKGLVQFWRRPNPATGRLAHDFADASLDTRFLGDLYQDLSEGARKKYALLQTPIFVEEFILDRTLGEALKALPLPKVTVIDPTCGSGHFLLGAFARLVAAWEEKEPGALREVIAQRALDQVAGVDLNPFAVAIARFRLLIAALRACAVTRLQRAPGFLMHIAVGDTLLHGDEPGHLALGDGGRGRFVRHAFSDEDLVEVNAILGQRFAVVVGNPPYITPKDAALRVAYKERYKTCHMKFALSVPFVERFWQLSATDSSGGFAGWVGQITAKSFATREFGKKLIEEFFPRVDLTHVIDAEGAYIPAHGTPTLLIFGRGRRPKTGSIRTAMGIRGEPFIPEIPSNGVVWKSIVQLLDTPGSENSFVSVCDLSRGTLSTHPWSLAGGGAIELKATIKLAGVRSLGEIADGIGFSVITGEDDALIADRRYWRRQHLPSRSIVSGDTVRDWSAPTSEEVFFPYEHESLSVIRRDELANSGRALWPWRTTLRLRLMFGKLPEDVGQEWHEVRYLARERVRSRRLVAFSFVSTHNHFVLARGDRLFKQSAPVFRLLSAATDQTYIGLLGLLNSSVACFWMKQVSHNMGDSTDAFGARVTGDPAFDTYQFTGTQVATIPLPAASPDEYSDLLDRLSSVRQACAPSLVMRQTTPTRAVLERARSDAEECLAREVSLQEELDWNCYQLYDIAAGDWTYFDVTGAIDELPLIQLGERAFEIVLARQIASGGEESTWFVRHGSTPITEIPAHWPSAYKTLVERRIALIESDRNIGLIERPEYKRRWNSEPWEALERKALADWLLDRLESRTYWPNVAFQTSRDLADRTALDPDFQQVAALYAGEGVALEPVIRELVLGEAVPFLPTLRHTENGREKRRIWERTWDLQRREDAVDAAVAAEQMFAAPFDGESIDALTKRLAAAQRARREIDVGAIPRPPKYVSADFQRTEYWRMRGALDVPKERFILYPFCNRDGDDAPLLGWAGWNHHQQAQALTAWYAERTQGDGWSGERVIPMLAGMAELVPRLRQWHNDLDPEFGDRPGEAYATWLNQELHAQGLTTAALEAWDPPRAARRKGRRTASKRATRSTKRSSESDDAAEQAE